MPSAKHLVTYEKLNKHFFWDHRAITSSHEHERFEQLRASRFFRQVFRAKGDHSDENLRTDFDNEAGLVMDRSDVECDKAAHL